jgi:hypothetical protein
MVNRMRRRHGCGKRTLGKNIGDDQVGDEIEKRRTVQSAASTWWQIQECEIRAIRRNWEPARAGSGGQQRALEYNAGLNPSLRTASESTVGVRGGDWSTPALIAKRAPRADDA